MNNKQQELGYLYIGLLQHGSCGLKELPTKGTNYKRIEICPLEWDFIYDNHNQNTENVAIIINTTHLLFSQAETDWGLIPNFGVFDSLIDGNLLAIGAILKPQYLSKDQSCEFKIGSLQIALDQIIKCKD